MAKDKNIEITMDSVKRYGRTITTLVIGKNEIGYIEPAEAKFNAFLTGTGESRLFKTEADAVNYLISAYHLHQR